MHLNLSTCTSVFLLGFVTNVIAGAAPVFGAHITDKCDSLTGKDETAAVVGGALAALAAETLIGLAASSLEEAGQSKSKSYVATFGDRIYSWTPKDGGRWVLPNDRCIVFWYSPVYEAPPGDPARAKAAYEVDDVLVLRWQAAGFATKPYLYGEVRVDFDSFGRAVRLVPVLIYARAFPEYEGFWRKPTESRISIDLTSMGAKAPFATHSVALPPLSKAPVTWRGQSTVGLASGWFQIPGPPSVKPPASTVPVQAGHVSGVVTVTTGSAGSAFARSLGKTLTENKQVIIDTVTKKPASNVAP
jgi:hypothetical protein